MRGPLLADTIGILLFNNPLKLCLNEGRQDKMKFNLEKSEKIQTLSLLLCLGAVMLSVIYIKTKSYLFLGGQVDTYLVSIYSFIPPNHANNPLVVKQIVPFIQPLKPIKDLLYGGIMGTLFLLFGYLKFKMRWLFHFLTASIGLGFLVLLFSGGRHIANFIGSELILASFCILVAITGVIIYRDK